jgi:putative salt-induced outer membrane protein YdiY
MILLAFAGTARADTIRLKQGDLIIGRVVDRQAEVIVVAHPVLGRLALPWDAVEMVQVGDGPESAASDGARAGQAVGQSVEIAETAAAAAETGDQPAEAQAEPPAPPESPWSYSFELSVDSSTGNTDEQSIRIAGGITRRTDTSRLTFDGSLYYKRSDSETTDNASTVGVEHDWLYPERPLFCFVQGRFDYDQFESWEQRVNGHGGIGYHLIAKDDFELDVRLGLGARKEFGSQNDDVRPEALLGMDAKWKISERQSIEASGRFFPVVEDIDDYRSRSTLNYRWLLSEEYGLGLSAGLRREYQSIVDPGKDRHDLRLFAGIRLDF